MFSKIAFGVAALTVSVAQAQTEVFGDLLVWCATEAGAENWSQVFETEGLTTNIDVLTPSFGCDVGFRVGANTCFCHDAWDAEASYTWFRSVGKDSVSTDGEITSSFLGNFYIGNADGGAVGPSYRSASIRWRIAMNVLDAQVGRMFCASRCLTLRPYAGLKLGWIDQSIRSNWGDPTGSQFTFTSATENLNNDFIGIGPMAGLDFKWDLGCNVSLFTDFSGALMGARWKFTDKYENNGPAEVTICFSNIFGAATMVRNFTGVGWECRCWTVRLGYEAQVWLGQLKLYTLNVGRLDNVLTFQGGSLDVRFAF